MTKIIQTFWISKDQKNSLLNKGGFICPEIHFMSWTLSCLQLHKFYKNVELHTNEAGKKILIDLLGLPYTKVHLSLENDFMHSLLPSMWAYSKIHTYSLQEKPFLHVDGDIFIWKAFDEKLMQSDLIAQNVESNLPVYKSCITALEKQASFVPSWLNISDSENKAYNAGIIGGTNIPFFKEYTRLAIQFYEENKNQFALLTKDNNHIHIIPEQYLYYALSTTLNIHVALQNHKIIDLAENTFAEFVQIEKVPHTESYIHLLSDFKKTATNANFVSFVLKKEYPEYWQKIIDIYKEKKLLSPYMKRQLKMQNSDQKTILQQVEEAKTKYLNTKYLCKCFEVDFENENQLKSNPILKDSYITDSTIAHFDNRKFANHFIKSNPYPTYDKIFNLLDFKDYYIFANPYHEIFITKYEFNENLTGNFKETLKTKNPYKNIVLLFLDLNYFSRNEIKVNDASLYLFEKIKSNPIQLKDLLASDIPSNDLLTLIKSWYFHGLIYFSQAKNDFIPQEPSQIYTSQINNIKTQVYSCLDWVINHYQIENNNKNIISQFNDSAKSASILEIVTVLKTLNFEAKGVRGTIENIEKITTPAIALIKLRSYLNLYIVITEITETEITIFNTEIKETEIYQKEYFSTIWDGILILLHPKNKDLEKISQENHSPIHKTF
ncbi:DUF6734 family protein [Flavobacterium sp. 5]|uniref:DUF6734 family protein n=1 Tax=Flavobacterium sp. 5 TaxID=2035199 RepID=UPI000C2B8FF4|nr:DUF6734 family protein [Flavobacterium sp. 5]PKB16142.1 peptidase C39-like protein [Flavobacterium sp. 5]